MGSVVDICKKSLAAIRAKSINSLTESSNEAQQCLLQYASARDFVMRDSNWQFAKKTAVLALLSEEPLQWAYAYSYPGDCLKVRQVIGDWALKDNIDNGLVNRAKYFDYIAEPIASVVFELQNLDDDKVIATDLSEAYVVYTKKIEDPNMFDPLFEKMLVSYLASLIAVSVLGIEAGGKMEEKELAKYQAYLATAVAGDQTERKRPKRPAPRMVQVRR